MPFLNAQTIFTGIFIKLKFSSNRLGLNGLKAYLDTNSKPGICLHVHLKQQFRF